ncbi:unnamed protein product [Chrysoparadoxa australica]
MEEVVLFNSAKERRKTTKLAELYAIILSVEHLESARVTGSIELSAYATHCSTLISQFKDAEAALVSEGSITSATEFMSKYQMEAPYAVERLIKYGVPATVLHRDAGDRDATGRARQAAEVTQCFITAMDALKLEQNAVDEIQPLISDLMERLNKCEGLLPDFVGTESVRSWLIQLNKMRASEELTPDQVRQLLHDLDGGYNAFFATLERT